MKLKEYLREKHIDPVVFSLMAGIGISSMYRYLDGKKCRKNTAYRIEKATNGEVTVEDMMGDENI